MSKNAVQQYRELLKDALSFIQTQSCPTFSEQIAKLSHRSFEPSSSEPKELIQTHAPSIEASSPKPALVVEESKPPSQLLESNKVILPEKIEKPPNPSEQKESSKKSRWELQPMLAVEAPSAFYKKLLPFISITEPEVPVWLILPEENGAHRLFLETVSKVITRTFAAASVLLYSETLFTQMRSNSQNKILLAPLSLLRKKMTECHLYRPARIGHFTCIALEPLDKYLEDMHAKRALWTTIQRLFPSSSTKG